MSVYQYEAALRLLEIAKDEAAISAQDFYERNWPFQTDEIYAQHVELQFKAVTMLAEFEQCTQQGNIRGA